MHFGVTLNDLGNLTTIALRMVFYLSGVFFNINERLHGRLATVLLKCNPIAFLMHDLRKSLIYGQMLDFSILGIWFVIALLLCAIGVHVIHKNENSYAKVI